MHLLAKAYAQACLFFFFFFWSSVISFQRAESSKEQNKGREKERKGRVMKTKRSTYLRIYEHGS